MRNIVKFDVFSFGIKYKISFLFLSIFLLSITINKQDIRLLLLSVLLYNDCINCATFDIFSVLFDVNNISLYLLLFIFLFCKYLLISPIL